MTATERGERALLTTHWHSPKRCYPRRALDSFGQADVVEGADGRDRPRGRPSFLWNRRHQHDTCDSGGHSAFQRGVAAARGDRAGGARRGVSLRRNLPAARLARDRHEWPRLGRLDARRPAASRDGATGRIVGTGRDRARLLRDRRRGPGKSLRRRRARRQRPWTRHRRLDREPRRLGLHGVRMAGRSLDAGDPRPGRPDRIVCHALRSRQPAGTDAVPRCRGARMDVLVAPAEVAVPRLSTTDVDGELLGCGGQVVRGGGAARRCLGRKRRALGGGARRWRAARDVGARVANRVRGRLPEPRLAAQRARPIGWRHRRGIGGEPARRRHPRRVGRDALRRAAARTLRRPADARPAGRRGHPRRTRGAGRAPTWRCLRQAGSSPRGRRARASPPDRRPTGAIRRGG